MKHFSSILFCSLLVGVSITSCVKEKNFPIEPKIEFKEYFKYSLDSADCVIKFKDGDGDIGVLAGDTVPDLKMKYLFKGTDGMFHPYDGTFGTSQFDTLFYTYRVPDLMPDGQYKALDGEIKIKLRASPIYNPAHHVVKFEIRLKDRAGHLSNIVTTNEINIP
jgi:hypothetical protein